MNKTTVLLAAAVLMSVASCKKEEKNELSRPINLSRSAESFRPLTMPINDLLLQEGDEQTRKIDMARYCLGDAVKEVITPDVSSYIFDHSSQSEWESVSFDDVFLQFPQFRVNVDQYLATHKPEVVPYNFTSYSNIKADMILVNPAGGSEQAIFEFNVPNFAQTSSGEVPIVTPGIQIEDEEGYEDQIMGWELPAFGGQSNIVKINESESQTHGVPLINIGVLTPSDRQGSNSSPQLLKSTATFPWEGSNQNIYISYLKINERFERMGKSEVVYQAWQCYRDISGIYWGQNWNSGFPGDQFQKIQDVHKDDIGKWLGAMHKFTKFFSYHDATGKTFGGSMWNTYERDWNESLKFLGEGTVNGLKKTMTGRMTHGHESYFYPASGASNNSYWYITDARSSDIWNANGNDVVGTGNYKSEMKFRKM